MLKLKTSYDVETGEMTVRFPKRVRELAISEGSINFTVSGTIDAIDAGVAGQDTIDVWARTAIASKSTV